MSVLELLANGKAEASHSMSSAYNPALRCEYVRIVSMDCVEEKGISPAGCMRGAAGGWEGQFRDDKGQSDAPSLGDSSKGKATKAALDLERSNSNSSQRK
jgi:hypothetical protein